MPAIHRIVIYTKKLDQMVDFYTRHFGFEPLRLEGDRIVELVSTDGGANLMLHPASKGTKVGQVLVKLVFDVPDVVAFKTQCAENGFEFGPVHQADGYSYANAKDPSKNSIQISSRAFRNENS